MSKRKMSDIEYHESGQARQDMYDELMRMRAVLTEIASWTSDPIAKKAAQNALTSGKATKP